MSSVSETTSLSRPNEKRPTGLSILSFAWVLLGLWAIFQSITNLEVYADILSHSSSPAVDPWWRFGLPAFIISSSFSLALGFLLIITASGFWWRKPWSYRMGLTLPPLESTASVFLILLLYSGASFGLDPAVGLIPLAFWILWTALVWSYLRRPYVKEHLHVSVIPPN